MESKTKRKSLKSLRNEIDELEKQLSKTKRDQLVISQGRSPTRVIYQWKAPERSFRPKDKNWYAMVGGVAFISILLAILTGTFLLVIAIVAVLAVLYAMSTIPPKIFDYAILNKGLKTGSKIYTWKQIPEFWITERGDDVFLVLNLYNDNSGRLVLLVGEGNINIIAKELIKYIDYLDPQEVKHDFILSLTEGKHKKLGEIIEDDLKENPKGDATVYDSTPQEVVQN